ncbi:MAG: 50S ribosomal protein L4 [SAR202 cluster bacterium]|nr:50S ribosomal protein L4 [SAR202 cluster bacterium]
MQISVKNQTGDALDNIELNDAVFDVPMNPTLVHQAMVIYQGNKRHGTSDTKTRAQVSGGGRKPWIQKHTGRARQGSTRSPQWRHGGVAFGPHPRSYRAVLPKRMKRQALRCVLSEKARKDRLICLDSTSTIDGKTKSMTQLLENLAIGGSALVVTKGTDRSVVLAANNLTKIWTLPVHQLNALELLSKDMVIMTVEAARWVEETLASEPHGRRGTKWTALSGGTAVAKPVVEEMAEPVADAAAEVPTEEAAVGSPTPRPRRRPTAAATTETAAPNVAAGSPDEEGAPKSRRRTTAAKPNATAEAAAEEGVPKPRTRRRRATANAADESAETTETPEPPEEEA